MRCSAAARTASTRPRSSACVPSTSRCATSPPCRIRSRRVSRLIFEVFFSSSKMICASVTEVRSSFVRLSMIFTSAPPLIISGDLVEGDVPGFLGVVQLAVGVSLDDLRFTPAGRRRRFRLFAALVVGHLGVRGHRCAQLADSSVEAGWCQARSRCRLEIPAGGRMIVICTGCQARFRVADEKVGPRGAKVRCSRCQTVFVVQREAAAPEPPRPEPKIELDLTPGPRGPSPARERRGPSPAGAAVIPFPASQHPTPAPDPFAAAGLDAFGDLAAADPEDPFARAVGVPAAVVPAADLRPSGIGEPVAVRGEPTPPPADPFAQAAAPDPFGGMSTGTTGAQRLPVTDLSQLLGPQDPRDRPSSPPAPEPVDSRPGLTAAPGGSRARGARHARAAGAVRRPGRRAHVGRWGARGVRRARVWSRRVRGGPTRRAGRARGVPGARHGPDPGLPSWNGPHRLRPRRSRPPSGRRTRARCRRRSRRRTTAASPCRSARRWLPGSGCWPPPDALALIALLAIALGFRVVLRGEASLGPAALRPSTLLRALGAAPAPAGPFELAGVRTGLYEQTSGGAILFVRGEVVSRAPRPVEAVRVEAELVRGGEVLARGEARAGVVPTPEEVNRATDRAALNELTAAMRKRAPKAVAPGERLGFLVPLGDAPADVSGASVRVHAEADGRPGDVRGWPVKPEQRPPRRPPAPWCSGSAPGEGPIRARAAARAMARAIRRDRAGAGRARAERGRAGAGPRSWRWGRRSSTWRGALLRRPRRHLRRRRRSAS